jgi:hypothetical protein
MTAKEDVAQEIAQLRALPVPDLVARYEATFGRPPRVKHREWLWKRIAWKLQEQRYGGLSQVAKQRLEELIAEIDLPLDEDQRRVSGPLRGKRTAAEPKLGAVLVRKWRDREITVTVVKNGFEHEGKVFRSLTAIADAVTGQHLNGKAFFGLSKRVRRRR